MRTLTKPPELEIIERDIDLVLTIDEITSLDEPAGISELNNRKQEWLDEITNYHTEMSQNKRLTHNGRVNFSKFKAQLEWIYNNPSAKRKTDFIKKIRDSFVNNGILCPYCGVSPCRTLDHYYNKALLPQFSFLPENLIPCCGDCNKDKSVKKSFGKWKRIINPYYDDYDSLLPNEPPIVVVFKENPFLNVDMSFVVTANNKLSSIVKKHINFHLKNVKIGLLHQEMISNSFWRNAKQLKTYKTLYDTDLISAQVYDTLLNVFICKNNNINYDWEYIIRFSLSELKTNHWIYTSRLDKLQ
ncbi:MULTISPECIES: hypothetical protein [Serratia]|uniref:hypothetical protein n=1 Tax=Serratia TaxID=613 RepID=UPI001F2B7E23|nr:MULTISPECIES: hypothetical protein [Serratia]MCE9940710.1 hypothetical protein [Serratia liquefaciens]